jgi:nucleotide-binding universal stress UspA family protein
MLKDILVTLDGSSYSEAALGVASELAAGTDAVVTLFTASEPPSATSVISGDPRTMPGTEASDFTPGPLPGGRGHNDESRGQAVERREEELEDYLEDQAKPLRDQGINVQSAVAIGGDPADLITRYARDHRADLIVMATHGRTGLSRLVHGSVAGKVLASGVRPVLMVRPSALGDHAP